MKKAVLLVNLGTPDSYSVKDVGKYLVEFLTDKRVIDLPKIKRNLLVRLAIVPKRAPQSAETYKSIWTEEGSPLLVYTQKLAELLQKEVGTGTRIFYAMRYQNPSIKDVMAKINQSYFEELTIVPLFPQYTSATSGSVIEAVMDEIKHFETFPKLKFISEFATHPGFINAFSERISEYKLDNYDHLLFSYHGLPKEFIHKADKMGICYRDNCCAERSSKNYYCYRGQCYATTRAIASQLGLQEDKYSVCFQSRLGKQEWIQPYTSDALHKLASQGVRKILVVAPSFVCDCIETIDEILVEYNELFVSYGGQKLDLVEGLNTSPIWVKALNEIITEESQKAHSLELASCS